MFDVEPKGSVTIPGKGIGKGAATVVVTEG